MGPPGGYQAMTASAVFFSALGWEGFRGAFSRACSSLAPDLAEKARMNEIESIGQVKWAVLETNGDISFIKRPGS